MFLSEKHGSRTTFLLLTAIVVIVASSSMFAFPIYRGFAKYALIFFCLAVLFQRNESWQDIWELKQFLFPWVLGFVGSLSMILIHGISGYSVYLESVLLGILLTLILRQSSLKKENFLMMLATFNMIMSTVILCAIYMNGLSTFILGVNKNILIISLSLSTSVILAEFLLGKRGHMKQTGYYLVSLVFAMSAIIFTEVRTAVLGVFSVLPLVFFYQKKIKSIPCLIMGCLLILLIFAFYESGRFHQGLLDLQKFEEGNSNSSWGIRLELYSLSVRAFLEQPVWGWGAGSIQEVIKSGISFGVPTFNAHHYHSDFFTVLASAGLLGLIFWVATVFCLFRLSNGNYLLIALLLASLAMGLTDRVWFDNKSGLLALTCLLTSLFFVHEQEERCKIANDVAN